MPSTSVGTQTEGAGYAKGMRVRHPTFGSGTICQVEGAGELQKVSVLFTNNSLKKFVAKYSRLELL
jgi:DNA helicase-2/ATP-dependent DNA helicase PcrA